MVHNTQIKAQYNTSINTYSFDNNFKYVKNYIKKSDLSIANLETSLTAKNKKIHCVVNSFLFIYNFTIYIKYSLTPCKYHS